MQIRSKRILLWAGLLACFCSSFLYAEPPLLPLKQAPLQLKMGTHLEYLSLSEPDLELSDVQKRKDWRRGRKDSLTFGFVTGGVWLRMKLKNQSDQDLSFYLQENFPLLDDLRFYLSRPGQPYREVKTGDNIPFSQRLILHRSFMVPLHLGPGEVVQVYIRYDSLGSIRSDLRLISRRGLYHQLAYEDPYMWMYFGFLLVILIYNSFLFLSIRDPAYLYYNLYLFFFLFMQFTMHGYSVQYLWPGNSTLTEWVLRITTPLTFCWFTMFLREFTGAKRYSVWLGRLSLYLTILIFAGGVLGLFIDDRLFWKLMVIGIGLYVVLFIPFIGVLLWRKSIEAWMVAIGFSFFIPAVLPFVLDLMGKIQASPFSWYGIPMGSALEITFLSLGLAYRINRARDERVRSETRFQDLVKNLNDIIFTLDNKLLITSLNPAVYKELGFEERDLLGTSFPELVYEQEGERRHRTRRFVKEQILALSKTNRRSSLKAYINTRFKPEPMNMWVEVELVSRQGLSQILVRMSPVIEGFLTDTLVEEHQIHEMRNRFSDVEFLCERLTSRLAKRLSEYSLYSLRLALREALFNAVEHGNLEVGAEQKYEALRAGNYPDLIRQRMQEPRFENRRVQVTYTLTEKNVSYLIRDEGPGFDHQAVLARLRVKDSEVMGLLRMDAVFDVMEFSEYGRQVLLVKEF